MLPEQHASKKKREANMDRLARERRSILADKERNLRGIQAAREALARRKGVKG